MCYLIALKMGRFARLDITTKPVLGPYGTSRGRLLEAVVSSKQTAGSPPAIGVRLQWGGCRRAYGLSELCRESCCAGATAAH